MAFGHFKRFRMEANLSWPIPPPTLPAGFSFVPWHPSLLERIARTKREGFRDEIDSRVFPCLASQAGCERLMHEITSRASFIPESTWLITRRLPDRSVVDCATVQGVAHGPRLGAIQNLAVAHDFRRLGLGRALVLQALAGFKQARMHWVCLEVTAGNLAAIRLYQRCGFRIVRTLYRTVEEPLGDEAYRTGTVAPASRAEGERREPVGAAGTRPR